MRGFPSKIEYQLNFMRQVYKCHYFTSHVTIDPRGDDDDEPAAALPAPETHDEFEFPKIRVVTIVCRHCGTKDSYDVTE